MKGGERECSKCVHGPMGSCAKADTRKWLTTDYGARFCSEMEREPLSVRITSAARRFAGEWPERKAVDR